MTTIAVVRKNGCAAIAADTMTKWGSGKETAAYIVNHQKIFRVGDSYLGVTGTATFQAIPEVTTWGLMIGGIGMVGVALRRRQGRLTFA
jgi:hypothetical protein